MREIRWIIRIVGIHSSDMSTKPIVSCHHEVGYHCVGKNLIDLLEQHVHVILGVVMLTPLRMICQN